MLAARVTRLIGSRALYGRSFACAMTQKCRGRQLSHYRQLKQIYHYHQLLVIATHNAALKFVGVVNHTEINLNDPFEKTLIAVLALPQGDRCSAQNETVALALRYLYTAAHGRTLRTSIGPISILPGVDSSLKDGRFSLCTRENLLALAERRTAFRRKSTQNGRSAKVPARSASLNSWQAGSERRSVGPMIVKLDRLSFASADPNMHTVCAEGIAATREHTSRRCGVDKTNKQHPYG